ncbi:hypothetical protein ACQEU3_18120 [Spirillospora sp. CA-253888]
MHDAVPQRGGQDRCGRQREQRGGLDAAAPAAGPAFGAVAFQLRAAEGIRGRCGAPGAVVGTGAQ